MSNAAEAQSKLATPWFRKANRLALISLVVCWFAAALFVVSSSHANRKNENGPALDAKQAGLSEIKSANPINNHTRWVGAPSLLSAVLPPNPGDPDLVQTFAADCTTPKSAFLLGEVACAKVSGGPTLSLYPRKITWVDNFNNIQQKVDIASDPQTDLFTIPLTGPVDFRGVWRVNSINAARSSVRASAFFTVSNPALPAADLSVYKGNDSDGTITAGSNILYVLWLSNKGPDAASNVVVTDATPANTTFLSGQIDDTNWTCNFPAANSSGGTTTCTISSLAPGASAKLTLVINVNSGASAGTTISNTGNISSDTPDPHDNSNTPPPTDPNADPSNNTATSRTIVVAGPTGATCTLDCPDNVNANANTSQNNQRGAFVTFDDAIATGDCGSVTATPASGSFFPVGTTVVNVTSETGGGACSFTVTVNDSGTNPPTISCPANVTANADNNCEAVVTLGTPTVTGDNVTVVGVRSDGKPMYNCDCFPNSPDQANDSCNIFGGCSRKNPDLPFSSGVTTVTWQAISHSTPGPYQTPADEEAARTGTASCRQTVTVNDVTPPVITATDQTVSADANCQAAVPDYSNAVTDNCACAANDTSQDCVGQHRITTTQDPAAGTLVGLGPHTIHLTANDGSSNNNGAGNTTTKDITLTVVDTTPPTFTFVPPNVTAYTGPNATTCDTVVDNATLGTATATDNCTANVTITRSPTGNTFPVGTTTITWKATDDAGNFTTATQMVTVVDNTPPIITLNGSTPSMWPPNHAYRTFNVTDFVTSVFDNCDSVSVSDVVIAQVTSDEPENAGGDGNTLNDIVISSDCKSVQLRAERQDNGDGRVYTITFRLRDTHGNTTTATARVFAPKNLGETPIDSGPHYTVTGGCP